MIQNWYTGTSNHGKCFSMFFNFLRFFLNPKIFFVFHRLEDSKNRISWIRSSWKILKKIILNSPYERVPNNQVLDFSKVYLCFHRTFMKNIEKLWNTSIFVFLNCANKLLKISKMNSTCFRNLIDQVLDTQLIYRWFPKDFKKYEYRRISKFFNIFNESPVQTQVDIGKI